MSHAPAPTTTLPVLRSKEDFLAFRERCIARWSALENHSGRVISVGLDSSSLGKGAAEVLAACERELAGTGDIVRKTSGNGANWMEPWVEIRNPGQSPILYGNIAPADVPALLRGELEDRAVGVRGDGPIGDIPPLHTLPFFRHQKRILLRDVGVIDPDSIEDAIAHGAYSGLFRALFELSQDEVIEEVTKATLRGRGGAGFPAGIKWASGKRARARPKYVVCNSHEGEPNVYKDRRIHEGDPHRILEGILIACVAVGADIGYNYIGGEYPLAIERFRKAAADAEALGLIGKDVLGSGKSYGFRLRTGGGAYVCGEGSALMYSIMGVRGQPRTKPPRSVEEGLWKRPTVANNAETLANIRDIVLNGGDWYAAMGNGKSTGTKLVTVMGPVKQMGLAEIEMGLPFRTLIEDTWGGMREGHTFKGIQTGGVSAGPLRDKELDVPVDFDSMAEFGGMLGSGGFVVYDENTCAVDFARYMMAFNRYESCSKCVPCRLGNPALIEIIDRIRLGRGSEADLALIERTSKHIIELSLCGLGQVAPMPLLGMIQHHREEFLEHIRDGVCRCGTCPITPGEVAIAAD
ncbi:MAG TPA: NADH-ubiquinone oxidoreductase-F iron-sulfur binding region domain-containing protein [Thermomicrobiales bacterium]|jgi:NADH:ubiquinone oxidoreductase subunit F (NADH-binding)|nr:NADH-ubiquinone oxidoreductase-F iron-sulfur binding region domain-containing protein [Thermomicrobiales bacterium]